MSWDQWVVLTFGVFGVFLAQTERGQKYACFPGLAGQIGWFAGVNPATQPGIFLVCVLYCAVWIYGLWRFWIQPWLSSAMTPTAAPGTGPESPRASGAVSSRARHPLRLVK